jgi:peptidoglycan/LPS O-acetylase OafA/YrhL
VGPTLPNIQPIIDFLTYFGSTFVITVALAAVSWLFVEKPALKLKPFRG